MKKNISRCDTFKGLKLPFQENRPDLHFSIDPHFLQFLDRFRVRYFILRKKKMLPLREKKSRGWVDLFFLIILNPEKCMIITKISGLRADDTGKYADDTRTTCLPLIHIAVIYKIDPKGHIL